MEERKKGKMWLQSVFSTKEQFVGEVEKIFSSLKDHQPYSLGVDMSHYATVFEVDVRWRISPEHAPEDFRHCSSSEVEFILGVVASRQPPNVKETKLSLWSNRLGDISDELWTLMSKLNNLTHLHIGSNNLRAVSPLLGDLIHLQRLDLGGNYISDEGVVGVCELLKVCCSSVG